MAVSKEEGAPQTTDNVEQASMVRDELKSVKGHRVKVIETISCYLRLPPYAILCKVKNVILKQRVASPSRAMWFG